MKAVATHDEQVEAMKSRQFHDWQEARHLAAEVKDEVLANLPELLERFAQNARRNGMEVLWAFDAAEARKYVLNIAREHQAKKIIKSKSMTTEEIDFNETCEANGLEVWESDLGELIVQLAKEKPYHIVTPAMHKNTAEIARLFQEKLGTPYTENAEELTMFARKHLREAYITADIGVTGANFLLAEEGAVVLTENEGNGRLTMACPPVHIAIAGIEKVLPALSDLALFLPLLATSGTGQQVTCYNSIIRGPKTDAEPDGPHKMYIILLDNGRSHIYEQDSFRDSLRCIRCGACLNACPVYRTVGGHTYHTTYQGPIGSVITPQLRDLQKWHHLPYASSLCAACSDVCPVEIKIHDLLLKNRYASAKAGVSGMGWSLGLKLWAFVFTSRINLNRIRALRKPALSLLKPFIPKSKRKRIPGLPAKTFAQLWSTDEQQG